MKPQSDGDYRHTCKSSALAPFLKFMCLLNYLSYLHFDNWEKMSTYRWTYSRKSDVSGNILNPGIRKGGHCGCGTATSEKLVTGEEIGDESVQ